MQRDRARFSRVVSVSPPQNSVQRQRAEEHATPHWILQLFDGAWLFGYLHAAIALQIFTVIAAGVNTAAEVAAATAASERGIRILLNALTALKLLRKDDLGRYRLEPHATAYLVEGGPAYCGANRQVERAVALSCWGRLVDAVRSGQPVFNPEEKSRAPEFWVPLAIALNALLEPAAAALVPVLGLGTGSSVRRVLDVSGGSRSLGQLLATLDSGLRVTLLDRAHVLRVAHSRTRRLGLNGRVVSITGRPLEVEWGEGYDLVLLSNVLQQGSPATNSELLRRAFGALRPGGVVVINELVADAERRLAIYPLLFAGALLLGSAGGDTYTYHEMSSWLEQAHFLPPQVVPVAGRINTLLLARKPA
jgi:2-polyprenyl-3-methyl-5-hydroxy-6-metoxy-1,4-benzoquinol methylase